MKPYFLLVAVLLISAITSIDAGKKRKAYSGRPQSKSKTKTKWSNTIENGENSPILATEEHGYYVKRTYLPTNETGLRKSPPYLAIPIAWFPCDDKETKQLCQERNLAAISGSQSNVHNGFLCDDDCSEPYEPICGKTSMELAVFYNKCKLRVAKCRSHGLWQEVDYAECQKSYPQETQYADKKFRASPFFKENLEELEEIKKLETMQPPAEPKKDEMQSEIVKEKSDKKENKETAENFNEIEKKISLPNAKLEKSKVL